MKYQKTAIVILNWNGWQDTISCVESILSQSYSTYDVIIVDNGSDDGSPEKLLHYFKGKKPGIELSSAQFRDAYVVQNLELDMNINYHFLLLKNPTNDGYARGNNIGIRFALDHLNPDYVLILNNDIILNETDTLRELIWYMEQNPRIGLISPVIRSLDGTIQRTCTRSFPGFLDFIFVYSFIGQRLWKMNPVWKKHFNYQYTFENPDSFDILSGSFMLFRATTLQEIGLFDKHTFLYWEENIIGKKLTAAGWKSVLYPHLSVIHKGEAAITTYNLKSWARYWSVKSEIYYLKKYEKMDKVKKCCIISVLIFESFLAVMQAVFFRKKGAYNLNCERKLVRNLINELFH